MKLKTITLFGLVILTSTTVTFAQQTPLTTTRQPTPPEMTEPVDSTFVPQVESKTSALQVLKVVRRDPFIRIRIKNVSDKNIYGFSMSYHKSGASTLFCFVLSDNQVALAPGEVYKYDHPFSPASSLAREPLTFQAVLFEDGTGDGDADKVKSLQDLFLTNRKELEHVIALVQAAIDSPEVETLQGLRELEAKVSEVPNYTYGVASNGLVGLTLPAWKETALHLIRDIEQKKLEGTEVKIQEELSKIKDRFSKTLEKYPHVS